ncbi:MAG TPA: hypothetical protein VE863_00330 [Pyrinomonadaceae bacterium]|jgi:hypothetical protein|nr:hypothetical protein [Pyrinomonadaceae bacterium]
MLARIYSLTATLLGKIGIYKHFAERRENQLSAYRAAIVAHEPRYSVVFRLLLFISEAIKVGFSE